MNDFELVKQRLDIVDVIGGYVSLQRAGRLFKAPCPFHQEKTPSFVVYPDRQFWKCYGACAIGGDVFAFVRKKENLTAVEALKLLAERAGIELTRRERAPGAAPSARMYEANEAAALFYHQLLLTSPVAEPARVYAEKRELSDQTIRDFQLGFAPDSFDSLRGYLTGKGYTPQELVAAGLLKAGERGQPYDQFRNRLMFPIRDDRGRVIGFGGRVFGDERPKYLNTPKTDIFDKGATLFALDRAKDAIRTAGMAVIVEGYMDAITAHQAGITHVIATLGTALTEQHVALLKRYTRDVVLSMDADAAGIQAALRGEEVVRRALERGETGDGEAVVDWRGLVRVQATAPVKVRVFSVPFGKDPDDLIRSDPDAFRRLADQATPPFEFRLRHELSRIDRSDPRERLALADAMLPLVAAVADRALQAQYLTRLAAVTTVPEPELLTRLAALRSPGSADAMALKERADGRLVWDDQRVGRRNPRNRAAGDAAPRQGSRGNGNGDEPRLSPPGWRGGGSVGDGGLAPAPSASSRAGSAGTAPSRSTGGPAARTRPVAAPPAHATAAQTGDAAAAVVVAAIATGDGALWADEPPWEAYEHDAPPPGGDGNEEWPDDGLEAAAVDATSTREADTSEGGGRDAAGNTSVAKDAAASEPAGLTSPMAASLPVKQPSPSATPVRVAVAGARTERTCLRLLLSFAGLRDQGMTIDDELFMDSGCRALFAAWRDGDPENWQEDIDEYTRAVIVSALDERMPPYDDDAAALALTNVVATMERRRATDHARLQAALLQEDAAVVDTNAAVERALGSLYGDEPPPAEQETEAGQVASRWLETIAASRGRLALEAALRTHGSVQLPS